MKKSALNVAISAIVFCSSGCYTSDAIRLRHTLLRMDVSPKDGSIVFHGAGKSGEDLYVLDLDGTRVRRLAATPESEFWPRFSPDGNAVVYSAVERPGAPARIFVRLLTGEQRQLTGANAHDSEPCFSPDGETVAFVRDSSRNVGGAAAPWGDDGSLWVIGLDGSGARAVTEVVKGMHSPCFEPDGDSILFSTKEATFQVSVSGEARPVRKFPFPTRDAEFLESGALVYVKGLLLHDSEVFLMDLPGGIKRKVTDVGSCSCPRFSESSARFFFLRELWPKGPTGSPKKSLWSVGLDGRNLKRLANSALFDAPLQWDRESEAADQ